MKRPPSLTLLDGPSRTSCGGDDTGTEIASAGYHECHICPVGVGEPSNAYNFGFGSGNPIIHQLVRNLKPPKFEDRAEDWPGFKWDFKEYLQKLSPTRPIPDAYKLGLLEEALTPTLKGEVKLMRKENGVHLHTLKFWPHLRPATVLVALQSCEKMERSFIAYLR